MKKIISSLFILSSIMFAQENALLYEDEVIIHLINYNNALVKATATRINNQGAKWHPPVLPNPYTMVLDEEFDVVTSGNWKAYYKIKSYNSTSETGFTNTAEIGVGGFFKDNCYTDLDNNNEFTLISNYPNPFNLSTSIEFDPPEASTVTLKIYNTLGAEVATLLNMEEMDEGRTTITFESDGLASGVYFYKLLLNNRMYQQIKKNVIG